MYFSEASVLPNPVMSVMGVLKGQKKHKIKEMVIFLELPLQKPF